MAQLTHHARRRGPEFVPVRRHIDRPSGRSILAPNLTTRDKGGPQPAIIFSVPHSPPNPRRSEARHRPRRSQRWTAPGHRGKRAFEQFANRARDELGDALCELRLFGSVARGNATRTSDIDIFAVVQDRTDKQPLHDIAFDVEIEFDIPITLIIRPPEERARMEGSRIMEQVEEEPRVV